MRRVAASAATSGSITIIASHTSTNDTSCITSACRIPDATLFTGGRLTIHPLRAWGPRDESRALEMTQRLAHGRAMHPELLREIELRRQHIAVAQRARQDLLPRSPRTLLYTQARARQVRTRCSAQPCACGLAPDSAVAAARAVSFAGMHFGSG